MLVYKHTHTHMMMLVSVLCALDPQLPPMAGAVACRHCSTLAIIYRFADRPDVLGTAAIPVVQAFLIFSLLDRPPGTCLCVRDSRTRLFSSRLVISSR